VDFGASVKIDCPRERAFDLMADARNEIRWNSAVSRSELLSGEPISAGSRFLTVNRGQEYEATIVSFERPALLVFAVTGKRMDINARFTFKEDAGGAAVEEHLDFRPKGVMKLFFPLLAPLVRRDLPKQGASFKAFCERTASGAGDS
jgi:Polyketide cyclase / dehydrase and lipid transport